MRHLVIVIASLALTGTAYGGNMPHPTLDALASEVAGKPVTVWCESSDHDWNDRVAAAGQRGETMSGYTFVDAPVIYVAPRICIPLRLSITRDYREAGIYHLSHALLTLAHEALHQRGLVDEGETNCAALPLVRDLAVKAGVPSTVRQPYAKQVWKTLRRTVNGTVVRLRVRTTVVRYRQVANPDLQRLHEWAVAWYRSSPPEYLGAC